MDSNQLFNTVALAAALAFTTLGTAHAQEPAPGSLEEEQAAAESDGDGLAAPQLEPEEEPPGLLGDEQADAEEEAEEDGFEVVPGDDMSPRELEDTDYFFLGAMAQVIIIPGFIQELFTNGGVDGINPGLGLTFNYRRNNFNLIVNAWWNNVSASGTFSGLNDPVTDTEHLDINLGVVFVNAAFLWDFPIDDDGIIAFELGFDLGFGFVYGDLVRTEATPDGDGGFVPCDGPGNPAGGYCEGPPAPDPCDQNLGGHYNCREPLWSGGGDVPNIVPWLSVPHIAIRIKPIRQLQIRIDGGWGIYNFFAGGSVSYGF